MFSIRERARSVGVLVAVGMLAAAVARPSAAADVVLFRVFLKDGTPLVSYGEYARIAADIVFSLPIAGIETDAPQLQLVSLPESAIDWPRTEAYAEAVRARHFADIRGEAEFGRLSDQVAKTLSDVALTEDPARRLAIADDARRLLADWPARNYGYRAADVAQLTSLLDEVVSELRVAAGQSRFDVNLVANVAQPPSVPLLPPPSLRESIEQAFTVARMSTEASQRTALLGTVTAALKEPARDGGWAAALRARATADLTIATNIDRAYADLAARTLKTADERARRADVKGLEASIREVLKQDDKLGRQRPQETAALLATLDSRLDATRRLRLARDRYTVRLSAIKVYERKTKGPVDTLAKAKPLLESIRQLAGPSAKALRQLQKSIEVASRDLALVKPAPDAESVHTLLTSAFQMAVRATTTRGQAIAGNDMNLAWQASSAAAGALLLLDRARDELRQLSIPPAL